MSDTRRRIVVGVAGGIAAFKAVSVVRGFVLAGHHVQVVATASALRFVGRPTWEAMSRNPVETDLFDDVARVRHVAIGQSADLVVIAPATANTLAKLAAGLADDLLGTTVLASTAPLVVAPAMHTEMWANAATRDNVATLERRGVVVIGPDSGRLTGDDTGPGRMSEPDAIVARALEVLAASGAPGRESSAAFEPSGASQPSAASAVAAGDLAGRRVLVTAGGTREPIDPVRFIGNRSSGRQGLAIALAAAARGAEVTLIAANLDVAAPDHLRVVPVGSAAELREAALREAPEAEIVVMAAAVADFRPDAVSEQKLKKDALGDVLELRLVHNPDILAELTAARRDGQTIVGFAAETEADPERLLELARAKAERKGADLLVVNRVGWTEVFGAPDNQVTVISGKGEVLATAAGTKASVADRILDLLTRPRS